MAFIRATNNVNSITAGTMSEFLKVITILADVICCATLCYHIGDITRMIKHPSSSFLHIPAMPEIVPSQFLLPLLEIVRADFHVRLRAISVSPRIPLRTRTEWSNVQLCRMPVYPGLFR